VRALIKTAPGAANVAVLDADIPTPGPGEALVRIAASGLCGTDLLLYDGVYRGRNKPVPAPLIVGHEAAGVVAALGAGVESPAPGTRVAIEAVWGCGSCYQCRRGGYNLCQDWDHVGLTRAGLLADYAVIPATSLLPLPDEVSDEAAAFLEPMATAVHSLDRIRPAAGASAAIVGPGPLGLLHLLVLQAGGAGHVVVYGREGDEPRLRVAESLGADTFIGDRSAIAAHARAVTGGIGFDVSIECGGTPAAVQSALEIVSGNGTMATLGLARETEIDALQVMRKNLTWFGVVASVRRHWIEAVELIRSGRVKPEALITHRLDLGEALSGFDVMRQRQAVKVMFSVGS
jgi:2-desacetyl-2-hydroxyethyl bacteriochlorophyllide A dehydrogenase